MTQPEHESKLAPLNEEDEARIETVVGIESAVDAETEA